MRRLFALILLWSLALGQNLLFVAPDDGVGYLKDLFRNAQTRIDIALYLWTRGRMDLVQLAANAQKKGVRVRVLLDPSPGWPPDEKVIDALKRAGVEVRFASPLRFVNFHQKAIIVDGKRLWISTGNLARSSFTQNREYSLLTDRSDWVEEAKRVFEADWQARPLALGTAALVWSPDRVLGMVNPIREGNAWEKLSALVRSARHEIFIEQNGFTDTDLFNELVAALERGVRVRLIGSGKDDAYFGQLAERLRQEGAEVRYLQGLKVHAKAMVVDRRTAFVGSQNFTPSGLRANRELGAIFGPSPALQKLLATMESDWASAARETPAPAKAIPWWQARRYLGQLVTVEGTVLELERTRSVYRLKFDRQGSFVLVIFKRDVPPLEPAAYTGQTVRVTGRVTEYRGRPEIIVKSPAQIEVIR